MEDNHFVAHPDGGVTTKSAIEADKANVPETATPAPETANDVEPVKVSGPEAKPTEEGKTDAEAKDPTEAEGNASETATPGEKEEE